MKKMFSCILVVLIVVMMAPVNVSANTTTDEMNIEKIDINESQVSEQEVQLIESYKRVVTYAEDNGIPLGMSYDVYLETYSDLSYEDIGTYENDNIEALENSKGLDLDRTQDVSPLMFEDMQSEIDASGELTDNAEPEIKDQVKDSAEVERSFNNILEFINDQEADVSITYDEYYQYCINSGLSLEECEQFVEGAIADGSYAPSASWIEQYYNNCGTSLPSEATYGNFNILSAVKKGDIFFENEGLASIFKGHSGIVVGRFYDSTRGIFYLRVVESIASGVKYGIIDDGRMDKNHCELYRVTPATSKQKANAVAFCTSQLNKPWSIIPPNPATSSSSENWYCSELVWAGYKNQGIDLDGENEIGILPSEICQSPYTAQYTVSTALLPSRRISDVSAGYWAKNAIDFVADNGLVDLSGRSFSPGRQATRAEIVEALYRMTGGEPYFSNNPFSDVSDSASYRDAIAWGYYHRIVAGVGKGQFAPGFSVTREDFVTFMYRFAKMKGYSTSFSATALNNFTDRGSVSSYALDAVKWAVTKGIMHGRTSTTLEPQGTLTRDELAQLVYKFVLQVM